MDDGYNRIRGGGRGPAAEIATNAFSDEDLGVLLAGLARLGLEAKALRQRILLRAFTRQTASASWSPLRTADDALQARPRCERSGSRSIARSGSGTKNVRCTTRWRLRTSPLSERGDVTFFCIDVDEAHNFVTAGGVVHNCRPPGNRDPLPIEIDNCQEYLLRQVELIQPTVICTLGNFSTKLLRGDPTGITRLHGQPEVLVLGRSRVRLYPIFHPRRRAVHAADARDVARGLHAPARAARARATRAAAGAGGAGSRAGGGAPRSPVHRSVRVPASRQPPRAVDRCR